MTLKPFDIAVLVAALLVIVLTRHDYRKGVASERVVILWSLGALCGSVLAIVPKPFESIFRAAGVINYPSAPTTLAILFLFVGAYGLSSKLSRTSQVLRRFIVRDAVRQVRAQADARGSQRPVVDAPGGM